MKVFEVTVVLSVEAENKHVAENVAHDIYFYGKQEAICKNDIGELTHDNTFVREVE